MGQVKRDGLKALLLPSTVVAANLAGTDYVCDLHRFHELVVTWDITAAVAGSGNTIDVYITSGDGTSAWDIAHFAQINGNGPPLRYTARILADLLPENVTSGSPGTAANDPSTLQTSAGGVNPIITLTSGKVRHGAFGDRIGFQAVIAGAGASFTFSIRITAAG
jgi:hypothetical protein